MTKHVLMPLGLAAAIALSGCGGGNGNGSAATGNAEAPAMDADTGDAGQLNSGMDPAIVRDQTSGQTANTAQPR